MRSLWKSCGRRTRRTGDEPKTLDVENQSLNPGWPLNSEFPTMSPKFRTFAPGTRASSTA